MFETVPVTGGFGDVSSRMQVTKSGYVYGNYDTLPTCENSAISSPEWPDDLGNRFEVDFHRATFGQKLTFDHLRITPGNPQGNGDCQVDGNLRGGGP